MSEHDMFHKEDYINPREGFAISAAVILVCIIALVFLVYYARKFDF